MADFSFHAGGPTASPGTTRLLHFCFYLGALLLLVAGVHALYLYFTAWSTQGDTAHLWQLALGIVYLLVSGLVVYATYTHHQGAKGETATERYVHLREGKLIYELDQVNGRQEIALDRIERVTRASVRDLLLELRGGERVLLPIYLIDDEAKQGELERALSVTPRPRS